MKIAVAIAQWSAQSSGEDSPNGRFADAHPNYQYEMLHHSRSLISLPRDPATLLAPDPGAEITRSSRHVVFVLSWFSLNCWSLEDRCGILNCFILRIAHPNSCWTSASILAGDSVGALAGHLGTW